MPVVSVRGELDLTTVSQLRLATDSLLSQGRRWLVLDLSQTSYIDSSAMATLVRLRRELNDGGGMGIAVGDGPADRL